MLNTILNMENRKIELLKEIDKTGSISKAAKYMGISYKTAWDYVNEMNNISKETVIITSVGGKKGGGSRLSDYSKRVVYFYDLLKGEYSKTLKHLSEHIDDFERLYKFYRMAAIRTSARNQFYGKVAKISKGSVISEIEIEIKGERIVSVITNESVEDLGLTIGKEIYAIIKATWIIISKGLGETSARNKIDATVSRIIKGEVSAEVSAETKSGLIVTSVITADSANNMDLKTGDEISLIFKAANVILGAENI